MREDLGPLDEARILEAVETTPREKLPALGGLLQRALLAVEVRVREAPAIERGAAQAEGLVPLHQAAAACGLKVATLARLARTGQLVGALPAPSRGKGSRRRWLVPLSALAGLKEEEAAGWR